MTPIDSLVDSYLRLVARATADLPASRRDELLSDLREHITIARSELDPETEAGVRTILDRLGDPATIAAEARRDEPPRPMPPLPPPAPNAPVAPPRSKTWVWVVVVLVVVVPLLMCLVFGALFFTARSPGPIMGDPVPMGPSITQPSQVPAPSLSPGASRSAS